MTKHKKNIPHNTKADREKILNELRELEKDLDTFRDSIRGYEGIPNKAEVGHDFTTMMHSLEEIADTIEALPKKLEENIRKNTK